MTDHCSLPTLATACPCQPDGSFFCPLLQRRMTVALARRCRDQPEYRIKWLSERDGRPVAPAVSPEAALWEYLAERHEIRSRDRRIAARMRPLEAIQTLYDTCRSCPEFRSGRCSALSGCAAIERYTTALLLKTGRCPHRVWC